MVCTVCLVFSSHYFLSEKKQKKTLWKNYQLSGIRCKKISHPFDGKNKSPRAHAPSMWPGKTPVFFTKNSQGPCNSGTPSHLYTTPIPFLFSNPLVRMGNSMGRLPEGGPIIGSPWNCPWKKPQPIPQQSTASPANPQLISGIPKLINGWLKMIQGYAGIFLDWENYQKYTIYTFPDLPVQNDKWMGVALSSSSTRTRRCWHMVCLIYLSIYLSMYVCMYVCIYLCMLYLPTKYGPCVGGGGE